MTNQCPIQSINIQMEILQLKWHQDSFRTVELSFTRAGLQSEAVSASHCMMFFDDSVQVLSVVAGHSSAQCWPWSLGTGDRTNCTSLQNQSKTSSRNIQKHTHTGVWFEFTGFACDNAVVYADKKSTKCFADFVDILPNLP